MNDFEYMVLVNSPNSWVHMSKRVWCTSHGIDNEDFYVCLTSSTDAWFFKYEADAVAFKLRFGTV